MNSQEWKKQVRILRVRKSKEPHPIELKNKILKFKNTVEGNQLQIVQRNCLAIWKTQAVHLACSTQSEQEKKNFFLRHDDSLRDIRDNIKPINICITGGKGREKEGQIIA